MPRTGTSAWMIAYNESYAVASFVEVGDSGGTTAARLREAVETAERDVRKQTGA